MPSRQQPGSFYALPQSPQLFKQLLMVAGIDRYYQIARCLRDEDLRADRQYEFMQLDAEMSFVDQDDVLAAIGEAVLAAAEAAGQDTGGEIVKITWHEAMNRFGVDKPDLRFGMELHRAHRRVRRHRVQGVRRCRVHQGHQRRGQGRRVRPQQARRADRPGQADRRQGPRVAEGRRRRLARVAGRQVPVARPSRPRCASASAPQPGDLLLIVADEWTTTCEVLGTLRNDLGRPPVHEGPYRYLWVVDFPLFVGVDEVTGRPKPGHHPFTQPHPDDVHLLETDPLKVRSQAYDLVLNGWELGSGSIRIHQPELQARIFRLLGISDEEAQKQLRLLPQPVPATAPRRTAASRSASTAWWPSSPARRTSARSSPSRRPSRAPTR